MMNNTTRTRMNLATVLQHIFNCPFCLTFKHREKKRIPYFLASYLNMTVISSAVFLLFYPSSCQNQTRSISRNKLFIYSMYLTNRGFNENIQCAMNSKIPLTLFHCELNIVEAKILHHGIDVLPSCCLLVGRHRTQIGFRSFRHQITCVGLHCSSHVDVLF